MWFKRLLLLFVTLLYICAAQAQNCPQNIGFEDGTFTGWQCYIGNLDQAGRAAINWGSAISPIPGRHTILQNTSPQVLDPYGFFPINCPNGSKYSLQLGDAAVSGGQAPAYCERMTYDFTVPNDDYTLVYYYAVVFQNPKDHDDFQQPQFIANVKNVDDPTDASCGSFSFTASAGLDGFQKSDVGTDIYFKPWSPITLRFLGKKGKHFQLEFITRDCSKGGHFGYAYLDFNENCITPITGNNYCKGATSISLTAPAGFEQYQWYDASNTQVGSSPVLKITPPPADGTTYSLHIVPYIGLGCENTFYTVVHQINEDFMLQAVPSLVGCAKDGIDLTQASVTAGSSPGLKYEYYTDANAQNYLSDPKRITETGTYYIRGTNAYGCTGIVPVDVKIYKNPALVVTQPTPVCYPATVDMTKFITTTETGIKFEYFSDVKLTVPVNNPTAINKTGTYYARATNPIAGCVSVEGVYIIVSDLPTVPALQLKACPPGDLTKAVNKNLELTYTYYADAQGTQQLNDPTSITASGTYYYKGTNEYNCEGNIAPIAVTIYAESDFTVTNPAAVVYPATINLADTHSTPADYSFTYWKDFKATEPLDNYQAIAESGTFYIKGTNPAGCYAIYPVKVQINAPPEADLVASNTFTPNGDGFNDEFRPTTTGVIKINYLKIFNRYGKQIFETRDLYNRWDGNFNGKPEPAGTYYWVFSCYDVYRKESIQRSGSITLLR